MKDAASKIGTWDILILNAGVASKPALVKDADVSN